MMFLRHLLEWARSRALKQAGATAAVIATAVMLLGISSITYAQACWEMPSGCGGSLNVQTIEFGPNGNAYEPDGKTHIVLPNWVNCDIFVEYESVNCPQTGSIYTSILKWWIGDPPGNPLGSGPCDALWEDIFPQGVGNDNPASWDFMITVVKELNIVLAEAIASQNNSICPNSQTTTVTNWAQCVAIMYAYIVDANACPPSPPYVINGTNGINGIAYMTLPCTTTACCTETITTCWQYDPNTQTYSSQTTDGWRTDVTCTGGTPQITLQPNTCDPLTPNEDLYWDGTTLSQCMNWCSE